MNSVKYFTQETGAQIFAKHNFQLKYKFHLEYGLVKQRYFEFFHGKVYIFILQTIVAQQGRFQFFFYFAVILVKLPAPAFFIFFCGKYGT